MSSDLGTSAARSGESPEAPAHPGYWRFYDAVAERQVKEWLPGEPGVVLDLSGADARYAAIAARAGHRVLHLSAVADPTLADCGAQVVAETLDLGWLRDGSVDAVIAENSALSEHLAAEQTFRQLHRVLKPGGRLFVCVKSLVLGLARLAEQHRWAELADVPSADVVLVENEDGSISRCFWPEELEEVLTEFGFDVDWVRPRTVLSPEAVSRGIAASPTAFDALVRTELALAKDRQGESTGIHLTASATRR